MSTIDLDERVALVAAFRHHRPLGDTPAAEAAVGEDLTPHHASGSVRAWRGRVVAMAACRAAMLLSLAACDPFSTDLAGTVPRLYEATAVAEAPAPTSSIVVLDWNIKFGGGRIDFFFDCFGDEVLMSHQQVLENLERIAAKIREVDPDIVLLQEVDINSKRSAFVDQLQWLLDHTPLNYGAYASHWRADYIPSDGLGAMDNGNAILSRWPITDVARIPLPLRTDQDALTRYFYLRRNVLRVNVDVPTVGTVAVVNVHTDAYGEDGTKLRHIEGFEAVMNELDDAGAWVIGGGDLNTLPPGSEQLEGFPDSVCEDEEFVADDYRLEVGSLDDLYGRYDPFVSLEDYAANNAAYYTHTVDGRGFWNRQLDYLFTNGRWVEGSGVVLQDERTGLATMPLSDHAPIRAELALP